MKIIQLTISVLILQISMISLSVSGSNSYLSVAAVQFQPRGSIEANTDVIVSFIEKCAEKDIRVAVFQECAITGYDKKVIGKATKEVLLQAEKKISESCKKNDIYAVVGTPHFEDSTLFNTAVVFDPNGETVARYSKIQLVGGDDWAQPGENLLVFKIDEVPCSIIICHDERYPELVKLPVLAGARLIFYVSSESSVTAESKLIPYRAQIVARADENDVYIVQANAPAMASHGQSRIIAPDGNLITEAGMFEETMVTATLDLSKASGSTSRRSFRYGKLRSWWEEGIKMVKIIE